eukprot:SAG11_NODE_4063_length_2082_cov_1.845688_2_plen_151_part_00
MFSGAPAALLAALETQNITMNNHHAGVRPATFQKILGGTVHMISTNVDRAGAPFVSTIESKAFPFYGSQWHPEKNGFEWTTKEAIPHSASAVQLMQWVANFFVGEARKSAHAFGSAAEEQAAVIYNFKTTFTGAKGSGFEQEYVWPQDSQ